MITAIIILVALNLLESAAIIVLLLVLRMSYQEIKDASALSPIEIEEIDE